MAEDQSNQEAKDDPFDNLLNLEDQYHTEGYNLGLTDGSRAGRIEGRIFGLEKSFEKFLEMGRLRGKAAVWSTALSESPDSPTNAETRGLSRAARQERLNKHISRLSDLLDIDTLSTENNEDAVLDFDDRLKDAKTKASLISKMVGEADAVRSASSSASSRTPRQGAQLKPSEKGKQSGEMEDFSGLPRGKLARE